MNCLTLVLLSPLVVACAVALVVIADVEAGDKDLEAPSLGFFSWIKILRHVTTYKYQHKTYYSRFTQVQCTSAIYSDISSQLLIRSQKVATLCVV